MFIRVKFSVKCAKHTLRNVMKVKSHKKKLSESNSVPNHQYKWISQQLTTKESTQQIQQNAG